MRKKCEARNPNTCYGCVSAKHEASESLCRKKERYEEEVRSTKSEYLLRMRECEARSIRELMQSKSMRGMRKECEARNPKRKLINIERNSFCYKTL